MADKIRVNYPALEAMARQCREAATKMQEVSNTAQNIAGKLQQGAMIGEFGDTFGSALGVFQQKVRKLADKFTEEASDIDQAMNDMRQADSSAGAKF
jgi:WXG100 family type VII secretion target